MSSKHATKADTSSAITTTETSKRWSLTSRLIVWYVMSGFCLILVSTGFLYWILVRHFNQEVHELMAHKIDTIRTLLDGGPNYSSTLQFELRRSSLSRKFVRIIDSTGQIIAMTPDMEKEAPANVFPDLTDSQDLSASKNTLGFRLLTARHASTDGKSYVIQVAADRSMDDRFFLEHRKQLWLSLASMLLIWGLVGYLSVRGAIRPLKQMADSTKKIHSMTLSERLRLDGLPAELADFGRSFNDLLERLDQAFTRLSQFSADIAHELRTPLNYVRGEIEVLLQQQRSPKEYQEAIGSCLEECVRLSHLIDNLLFLARAEDPKTKIQRTPLNIHHELSIIQDFYEPMANDAGVGTHIKAPDDLTMELDRSLFQRAVGNLLANGISHTPRGGSVTIAAVPDALGLRIHVTDTGCGISAEHLPNVFNRFYRVDRTRSATSGNFGLGLSIVKGIATLHAGTVTILSKPGSGTQVTLSFPSV